MVREQIPYFVDRVIYWRFRSMTLRLFAFPVSLTALNFLFNTYISPFGAWTDPGNALWPVLDLKSVTSILGLHGLTFVLGIWSTMWMIIWDVLAGDMPIRPVFVPETSPMSPATARRQMYSNARWKRNVVWLITVGVLAGFILIGSSAWTMFWNADGSGVPTVSILCQVNSDLARVAQALAMPPSQGGYDMVVMTEDDYDEYTPEDEAELLHEAANIASRYKKPFVMGYALWVNTSKFYDKFVLVNASGAVVIEYMKAHPIPLIDSQCMPGSTSIPVVSLPGFGRVALTMGYDMDFPDFIWQAGRQGVDLMIQTAFFTLNSMSDADTRVAMVRTTEQGFNLFRCAKVGTSVAMDYQGHPLAVFRDDPDLTNPQRQMAARVPARGYRTLYSYIGSSVGWFFVFLAVLLIAAECLPLNWIQSAPLLMRLLVPVDLPPTDLDDSKPLVMVPVPPGYGSVTAVNTSRA